MHVCNRWSVRCVHAAVQRMYIHMHFTCKLVVVTAGEQHQTASCLFFTAMHKQERSSACIASNFSHMKRVGFVGTGELRLRVVSSFLRAVSVSLLAANDRSNIQTACTL